MSKQQTEVTKILSLIYQDLKSEIGLEKITKNPLHRGIRVDIWIPCINCVVEIHGQQHFKPSSFGKDNIRTQLDFLKQQNRDTRLMDICNKFNINYEQIDYNEKVDFTSMFRRFSKYGNQES